MTFGFMEFLSGLANNSRVVSKVPWMTAVRRGGSGCWLINLRVLPWGVRIVDCGWYLCTSLVIFWVKLVVGVCFVCWM